MELFDERVVLFESDEGGEHLRVSHRVWVVWWCGRRARAR